MDKKSGELKIETNSPKPAGLLMTPAEKKKVQKKIAILCVALVAVVLVGFLGLPKIFEGSGSVSVNKHALELFDESRPIVFRKDDKYGYVALSGKVLLDANYISVGAFHGDYARVQSEVDGRYKYYVIDKKGKRVSDLADYESDIQYDWRAENWLINGVLYNAKLKRISSEEKRVSADYAGASGVYQYSTEDGEVGVLNSKGKVIMSSRQDDGQIRVKNPIITDGYTKRIKNHYCVIERSSSAVEYGVMNCETGKMVVEFEKGEMANAVSDGGFEIRNANSGKYVFIWNDAVVYEKEIEKDKVSIGQYVVEYYGEDILRIRDIYGGSTIGYYDFKHKKDLTQNEIDELGQSIFDGLYRFVDTGGFEVKRCDDGRYALNDGGRQLGACEWDSLSFFNANVSEYLNARGQKYALGSKSGRYYLIKVKNKKIVQEDLETNYAATGGEEAFFSYRTGNGERRIYSLLAEKWMTIDGDAEVSSDVTGVILKKNDGSLELYNKDLKKVLSF